jgi:hypothetical protein
MLSQDSLQRSGIKYTVVWNLVDDVGEVCKEVALILVSENGRDTCVVELDIFVVDSDEVNIGVRCNERCQGIGDDL